MINQLIPSSNITDLVNLNKRKKFTYDKYCRVNFKKNEKNYNAENSEVFKMVQEADKEPKTPEPG